MNLLDLRLMLNRAFDSVFVSWDMNASATHAEVLQLEREIQMVINQAWLSTRPRPNVKASQ